MNRSVGQEEVLMSKPLNLSSRDHDFIEMMISDFPLLLVSCSLLGHVTAVTGSDNSPCKKVKSPKDEFKSYGELQCPINQINVEHQQATSQ